MERYDIRQGEWRAEKAEAGDFVLYADAQATVEALQRENECKDTLIATLQAQLAQQAQGEKGVGDGHHSNDDEG